MYLCAVVPTIAEEGTIRNLVASLFKVCEQVIVVDASPSPETLQEARRAHAMTIDQTWVNVYGERNTPPGLGPAYKAAHRWIPLMHTLHIDAGGSHNPADVYPMIELAEEGFDVVIGSRFCPGGEHHGPWRRRVTSRWAAKALNLISLQDIADWTSGFRIYSPRARQILAQHTFTTTGHAWQIEALNVLLQHGMRVVEHPITYESSVSHLSSGRVKEAAALWWRLART